MSLLLLSLLSSSLTAAAYSQPHLSLTDEGYVLTFEGGEGSGAPRVKWAGEGRDGSVQSTRVLGPADERDRVFEASLPADTRSYELDEKRQEIVPRPAPSVPIRVAFIADMGAYEETVALWRALEMTRPDLVLIGGDITYAEGRDERRDEWFAMVGELAATTPIMTAIGNHELLCHEEGACIDEPAEYREHFRMPNEPHFYYSFDAGPARFISLDTEAYHDSTKSPTDPDVQREFLVKGLAQSSKWNIVFFHRPIHSTNLQHGDGESDQERADLVPAFEAYGADLVLSGHVHAYERTHPLIGMRPTPDGVVYVTSGGGGRELHESFGPERDWSAKRFADHHFLLLDVTPDRIDGQAIGIGGAVLDTFVLEREGAGLLTQTTPGPAILPLLVLVGIGACLRRRGPT